MFPEWRDGEKKNNNSIDFCDKKWYSKSMMKIKKWEKPQLIVLARGRPEEAVLGGCKSALNGPGPLGTNCEATEPGVYCDASHPS